jgi:hypothetical protein
MKSRNQEKNTSDTIHVNPRGFFDSDAQKLNYELPITDYQLRTTTHYAPP